MVCGSELGPKVLLHGKARFPGERCREDCPIQGYQCKPHGPRKPAGSTPSLSPVWAELTCSEAHAPNARYLGWHMPYQPEGRYCVPRHHVSLEPRNTLILLSEKV